MCIYTYTYLSIYIYIYIERERERERLHARALRGAWRRRAGPKSTHAVCMYRYAIIGYIIFYRQITRAITQYITTTMITITHEHNTYVISYYVAVRCSVA